MFSKTTNILARHQVGDAVIVTLPEDYSVGVTALILDLVRRKQVTGSQYIVIDYTHVRAFEGGLDSYILRDEFREAGGRDVLIVGVPDHLKEIFALMLKDYEGERVREFTRVDHALQFIKQSGDANVA